MNEMDQRDRTSMDGVATPPGVDAENVGMEDGRRTKWFCQKYN